MATQQKVRKEVKPVFTVDEHTILIKKEGKDLIVPQEMTLDIAIEALRLQMEEEDEIVTPRAKIDCYPLDGILAVNRAMAREFGSTKNNMRNMFGGKIPAISFSIDTGKGNMETAFFGEMHAAQWEDGCLTLSVNPQVPLQVQITGNIKKKFEPQWQSIVKQARALLKSESIYRGKALEVDLGFVADHEQFNPEENAPKFMDCGNFQLVLTDEEETELNATVWGMIRNPAGFRANGIKLKFGILLSGEFGTGKSLTSNATARLIEQQNEFTFFYLKTPAQFIAAHKLAQLYAPCVLFVEDIDAIFGGGRTEEMNAMLEAMDGVASKGAEVIVMFTTNFPEKINPAFMRPGRVDVEIRMGGLDAKAAQKLVRVLGRESLAKDVDYDAAGEAFDGLVPARIVDGIEAAKRLALAKNPATTLLTGILTTESLVSAAHAQKKRLGMGDSEQFASKAEFDLAIIKQAEQIKNSGSVTLGRMDNQGRMVMVNSPK